MIVCVFCAHTSASRPSPAVWPACPGRGWRLCAPRSCRPTAAPPPGRTGWTGGCVSASCSFSLGRHLVEEQPQRMWVCDKQSRFLFWFLRASLSYCGSSRGCRGGATGLCRGSGCPRGASPSLQSSPTGKHTTRETEEKDWLIRSLKSKQLKLFFKLFFTQTVQI